MRWRKGSIVLTCVFRSAIGIAFALGLAAVVLERTKDPFLIGVMLVLGAVAGIAYAGQNALEIAIELSLKRRRQTDSVSYKAEPAVPMLLCFWETSFVIGPLAIAVVAIYHALRAFSQLRH